MVKGRERSWLVYAFADERQYGGNTGYPDVLEQRYAYDSNVQNSRKVREGDLMVVCGRDWVLGLARVDRLDASPGQKTLYRCPECATTKHGLRPGRRPLYRCKFGHEFDVPVAELVPVTRLVADYGDSFLPVPAGLSRQEALEASSSRAPQLSIRSIDLDRLWPAFLNLAPAVIHLRAPDQAGGYVEPGEAGPSQPPAGEPYLPDGADTREQIMGLIRARRGQMAFRNALRQRYGDRCMISGCALMDVVEAAHISPYRGIQDQHPENGLLLRADLHTLFDIDLLGIEPETLRVVVHPRLEPSAYAGFARRSLLCSGISRPSKAALVSRWRRFRERLDSGSN